MNRFVSRTLLWDGVMGMATCRLAHVPLKVAPKINGKPVLQIDYAPLVGLLMILEDNGKNWRELTHEERVDIDKRLQAMLTAGQAVWE